MKRPFFNGVRSGVPIGLAYFAVSFGFGIMCKEAGLTGLAATLISATNLTSAGQAAGLSIIIAGGTLVEMALTQFVINLRYSLMAVTLSQNLSEEFTPFKRMLFAFGITDEIFAMAAARKEPLRPAYCYGLMVAPFIGWTSGTLLGATAGALLPADITAAMGILLYGMFIAIIVPPARENRAILFTVLLAAALSVFFCYAVPGLGSGFSVIICSVCSAALLAVLRPVDGEPADDAADSASDGSAETEVGV